MSIKEKMIKKFLPIIGKVIGLITNERLIYSISKIDPKLISMNKKSFISVHLRPKSNTLLKPIENDYSDVGIIIQGPIEYKDDFTLNTIRSYKKMFTNAKIVLSTWETEDKKYLELIKKENIKIILNKYPKESGLLNLNYQLVTTKSAIDYIEEKCEYILKTRTDARIYNKFTLEYLKNLIKSFPSKGKFDQKFRIIGIDINTAKYVPFSFSDIFQFGHKNDMKKLWDIDLDKTSITYKEFINKKYKIKEIYKNNNPEVYIMLNYIKKIGFNPDNTYESYYDALSKLFIVIDKEMINYYWYKYSSDEYYWNCRYSKYYLQEKIRFNDWLQYYNDYNNAIFDYSYYEENI